LKFGAAQARDGIDHQQRTVRVADFRNLRNCASASRPSTFAMHRATTFAGFSFSISRFHPAAWRGPTES
jgi:hypothetical protein